MIYTRLFEYRKDTGRWGYYPSNDRLYAYPNLMTRTQLKAELRDRNAKMHGYRKQAFIVGKEIQDLLVKLRETNISGAADAE